MTDEPSADFDFDVPEGEECHNCEGTGEIIGDDDLEHTCPSCGGSGFVDPGDDEPNWIDP